MSNKPGQQDQQSNGRNEYIPAYISKAPFYAQGLSDSDYLEHQRLQGAPQDTLDKAKWYERGRKVGPAATKYRKGACENCGAMTHKTKECLSRPRKQGAKWTGRDIQADERVEDVKLGWDAKRDRWNGYDSREYAAVIQEHEELEALRKAAKPQSDQKQIMEDGEQDGTELKDDSEARYAEETDMGRGQSNATRQLRLREDTAKYLLNLDLDSAKYDPKTRSMDTTSQNLNQNADSAAEEGFVRPTGASDDAAAFERAQRYAWETQELASLKANDNSATNSKLHLQANPTEGEILLKKRQQEESTRKNTQRQALLEKYGDQPHLSNTSSSSAKPFKPTTTSTESYIEYDPKTGKPKPQFNPNKIKSQPRSKYAEDILTNNHTSVWGSWWNDFRWGYACCHSTTKNSYCTGEQGKIAFEEAEGLRTGLTLPLLDQSQSNSQPQQQQHQHQQSEKPVDDENETERPSKKKRRQLEQNNNDEEGIQRLRLEQQGEDLQFRKDRDVVDTTTAIATSSHLKAGDGKQQSSGKRTFGDMRDSSVTEEEMESYKRSRAAADDPMKAFGHLGGDGVLEHESVPAS